MSSNLSKLGIFHILALAFGMLFLYAGIALLISSYSIWTGGPYEHIAISGVFFFFLGGGLVSIVIGIILLIAFYSKYRKIKRLNE